VVKRLPEDMIQKNISFEGFEIKASDEEKGIIEGYAATFGNIDRHGDIIAPDSFKGGRSKIPIFALHRSDKAVGVGYVQEDEKGLKIKMKLAVDSDSDILRERAKEYHALVKEGIIEKMSVGMIIKEREWVERAIDGRKRPIRMIKKADLVEVSLVPIPANDKARITSVKDLEGEDFQRMVDEAVQKALKEKADEAVNEAVKKSNRDALLASRLGLF
jgi:HK97 family phage prohead protease